MDWYQYLALAALVYCVAAFSIHLIKIIRLGKPKDLSHKSGSVSKGVWYANTVSMMPQHKETAYLHLPTYTLGIIYHLGTFLSLLLFVLLMITPVREWLFNCVVLSTILSACLSISMLSGLSLLCKRILKKEMCELSHLDDFISNFITTLFHLFTFLVLIFLGCSEGVTTAYYLICTGLFIYMPLGKLRHVLYYFSARFHLGFFYGWRNVWPQK